MGKGLLIGGSAWRVTIEVHPPAEIPKDQAVSWIVGHLTASLQLTRHIKGVRVEEVPITVNAPT